MQRSYPQREGRCALARLGRCSLLALLFCQLAGWNGVLAQSLPSAVKAAKAGSTQTAPPADASTAPAATPPPAPEDPLGRISPHGTVLGFLRAAEEKDYVKAAKFLDGKRSPEQATELIEQLKYLMDQGLSTSIDDISRSPKGDVEDEMRLTRERVGTIKTPDGEMDILLDLIRRPGEPSIWLFSQETLNRVPEIYSTEHRTNYEDYFPSWTRHIRIFSVPLWRWAVIFIFLLLVFGAASLITKTLLWLLPKILRKRFSPAVEASVLALKLPVFCLIGGIMNRFAATYAMTALGRHYWSLLGQAVVWISSAWLLMRITDILTSLTRQRLLLRMQVERATFISLLGRVFKILIGLVLILVLLTHAGVNVSALITGLGIGGVALALAAQKTLSDLFGGLSIIMRGAVRVGDFCEIAGITGTVEDIGTSSLSLRTLGRSMVSIPNSKVAEANLDNYSMRDQFWLRQAFTLRFDTPSGVLKTLLQKMEQLLLSHPEIEKASARARLINLTASGPQIEVFAYFRRPGADWAVFLQEQEKLLLQMIRIVEDAGSSLAAPIGVLRMDSEKPPNSSNPPSTT
jgi:MscS family membrane protein